MNRKSLLPINQSDRNTSKIGKCNQIGGSIVPLYIYKRFLISID